jgi:hypothetical protein
MSNAFVGGVERMKVKVGCYAPPPMVGRRGRSILFGPGSFRTSLMRTTHDNLGRDLSLNQSECNPQDHNSTFNIAMRLL